MTEITKPTFVVNKEICLANIEKMARKAETCGMRFRPHFKTHQSAEIGEWFRNYGVNAITVSSVSMASYFAGYGWEDITIAFPVNILEIGAINDLAGKIELNLLVENEGTMTFLAKKLTARAGIYIETDTGYHRSGIETVKPEKMDKLIEIMKNNRQMSFKGFLSHTGQTYSARSRQEIVNRHSDALMKMRSLKQHYQSVWPEIEISLGDTPACSVCDNWEGVDEMRPGNFVFYDLMQFELDVCRAEDIAATLYCPVVSKSIMRNEVVVYGGAVHLSKEYIIGANGKKCYGAAITLNPDTQHKEISRNFRVAGLSQEHGVLRGDYDDIKNLHPGDLLEIIPVHSCLTADLAGYYLTTRGEVIEKMSKRDF